ncbi:MAG: DoxX family protein [Bacteroidetes bacterium CG18_big_fil_WC_8_21_14_2_50_41_14]|nr:MAG: DoxX family protein [Bacteroidetes bacterium CG18_big_fil_WC_8_21_14_2_50_41_14]PJB59367.1 MAG: DoxX family protein [Bacteroidetes bacterium CG_4_9_14_3_um_filter_41_19]
MKIIQLYQRITDKINGLRDISLVFFRLILAYGFYGPAMMKWGNLSGIADWFAGMGIPFPTLNAYLAASTEMAAVVLLPLGLFTRIISIPLMITMVVAIATVHFGNGFEAGDNGFEIPLYYLLMLFALLVNGAGKMSLDHLISRRIES